jgi:hypothetical protein
MKKQKAKKEQSLTKDQKTSLAKLIERQEKNNFSLVGLSADHLKIFKQKRFLTPQGVLTLEAIKAFQSNG